MKTRIVGLMVVMVLAANIGLAQAVGLDNAQDIPDVINGTVANEATLMTPMEMEIVHGQNLIFKEVGRDFYGNKWKITVRKFREKGKYKIETTGSVPYEVIDLVHHTYRD